jgi:hypothetical protein
MKDLSLTKKFDAVLKALYDISGNRPSFERILNLLNERKQKVDIGEIWDIFKKMERDNLLHLPHTAKYSEQPDEILHLITFEGKLMHERHGLKGQLRREGFTKVWVSAVTILTLIISGLTFYYVSKGVSDDTLNKVNETLQKELPKQDSLIILENRKLIILQRIADSVSKKK